MLERIRAFFRKGEELPDWDSFEVPDAEELEVDERPDVEDVGDAEAAP